MRAVNNFGGQPKMLTLLTMPREQRFKLDLPRILTLDDVLAPYFKGQGCLKTNGPVDYSMFFEGAHLTGTQLVHLFAHISHNFVKKLVSDDSVKLEDRLLRLHNQENIIIVYPVAIDEVKLIQVVSVIWAELIDVLRGESQFPDYNEMEAKIATVLARKPMPLRMPAD